MACSGSAAHGDYVFGWKDDTLQRAMDQGCNLNNNCPGAGLSAQTPEVYNACKIPQQAPEEVDGCRFPLAPILSGFPRSGLLTVTQGCKRFLSAARSSSNKRRVRGRFYLLELLFYRGLRLSPAWFFGAVGAGGGRSAG